MCVCPIPQDGIYEVNKKSYILRKKKKKKVKERKKKKLQRRYFMNRYII